MIIQVPVIGIVDGVLHDVRVERPLDLLYQLQRSALPVVLEHKVGALGLVKGQIHPHHIAPPGIEALLVALDEGLFFDPDI